MNGVSDRSSRRELASVACALLLPIPLLVATGLNVPLPGVVERAVASLLPGAAAPGAAALAPGAPGQSEGSARAELAPAVAHVSSRRNESLLGADDPPSRTADGGSSGVDAPDPGDPPIGGGTPPGDDPGPGADPGDPQPTPAPPDIVSPAPDVVAGQEPPVQLSVSEDGASVGVGGDSGASVSVTTEDGAQVDVPTPPPVPATPVP